MPSLDHVPSLESLATEYELLIQGCGLLDRSQRGKLALSGRDSKVFLQGQLTNDIEALTPGQGCYAAFLTPKGKMLGDLRVLDSGPELLLDTERIALQPLFNMIHRFSIGYDVELHKRTVQCGLLSLIGPQSSATAGAPALADREHAHAATDVGGVPARAIRTDVGIDLLCEAADTPALIAALADAGAAQISEAAAECLRIEHGRPRYGVDLDDTVIPEEAGLNERAVSFTKGCYVGQETVARLHYRGKPNRRLRGLRLSAPAQPCEQVTFGERVVGELRSTAVSPRLGPIALALIRREAPDGAQVAVGARATAEVVALPFA